MRTLVLPRGVAAEIFRAVEKRYPLPACGLLLGRAGGDGMSDEVTGIRQAPAAALDADAAETIGAYHSRPDGPARPPARAGGPACLVVSVRPCAAGAAIGPVCAGAGVAAEWGCWTFDKDTGTFEPRIVRLTAG